VPEVLLFTDVATSALTPVATTRAATATTRALARMNLDAI
jgi:hypothetical protein